MDTLSSMANISGYKGVLMAANELPKYFPMFMTAAGTVFPAKVFVIGAAVAGLPLHDTLQRVDQDGAIARAVRREGVWSMQTPQAFRADLLREAHGKARRDGISGTDDAMLVERLGRSVVVLQGDRANIKITTPEDLIVAEALLRERRVP